MGPLGVSFVGGGGGVGFVLEGVGCVLDCVGFALEGVACVLDGVGIGDSETETETEESGLVGAEDGLLEGVDDAISEGRELRSAVGKGTMPVEAGGARVGAGGGNEDSFDELSGVEMGVSLEAPVDEGGVAVCEGVSVIVSEDVSEGDPEGTAEEISAAVLDGWGSTGPDGAGSSPLSE
jgi:hypothetical protein